MKLKKLTLFIFSNLLAVPIALAQSVPEPAATPAPETKSDVAPQIPAPETSNGTKASMPVAGTSVVVQNAPPIRPVKLARLILIALDQANKTGNYSVLQDLGAPAFRANSAARLAEVFAPLRRQGVDLSMAAVLEPQFAAPPRQGPQGLLRLVGAFPQADGQGAIGFDLRFAPINGYWRIYDINVGPTQLVAPNAPNVPAGAASSKSSTSRKRAPSSPPSR